MRFLVRHNRHHKVFLRIKVGGHFVMSIVKCHESHYVGVLDNPHNLSQAAGAFKGGRGDISRCWVEISSDQA